MRKMLKVCVTLIGDVTLRMRGMRGSYGKEVVYRDAPAFKNNSWILMLYFAINFLRFFCSAKIPAIRFYWGGNGVKGRRGGVIKERY